MQYNLRLLSQPQTSPPFGTYEINHSVYYLFIIIIYLLFVNNNKHHAKSEMFNVD